MIVPMEKVYIAGPRTLAPAILLGLQEAGVVHVDLLRSPTVDGNCLDDEARTLLRRWDGVAIAADHALRLLDLTPDPRKKAFAEGLPKAEEAAASYEQRAAELAEKQRVIREELDFIRQYRRAATLLADMVQRLDQGPWLTVLPFVSVGTAELASLSQALSTAIDGRFVLAHRAMGDQTAAVLIVLNRDAEETRSALSRHGLSELPRPGLYARMALQAFAEHLVQRSDQAPRELDALEAESKRLAKEGESVLKALWSRGRNESLRLRMLEQMVGGHYGFVMCGWVPVRFKPKVEAALEPYAGRTRLVFESAFDPEDAGQVPVMLNNPGWVKPFEYLILFLNTPRYDSWDPTWVVAAFFPLWFGMIVGDIGYALIFAVVALYCRRYARHGRTLTIDFFKLRLPPPVTAQIVRVLNPMIVWTVLWGLVYGECFGDLLQKWGVFAAAGQPGWLPVLIPRTDTAATANALILTSIGFGAWQVLYGFYRKARYMRRHGSRNHFWESVGYFGGVSALIVFAYAYMARDFGLWLMIPAGAGAVVFLTGVWLAKMPLMAAELPTQAGHILSYIRIYAVGLASAVLADLATDAGFALHRQLGIPGILLGVLAGAVLGVIMHALLLVLLTVGHVLQPIRLIWVEFFTKFDFYTISGRPFRPFRFVGTHHQED